MPLAFLTVATGAHAVVAFTNFGPSDEFGTGSGYTIGGPTSVVGNFSQGEQFEAGASGSLDSIRLALQHVSGANNFEVTLYEDAGDAVGSFITSWTGGGLGAFGSTSILTLNNAFPEIELTAGSKYWLVAAGMDDVWSAWMINNQGDMGGHTISTNSGASWSYTTVNRGAFEVNVVPEPVSMGALAAGLGGLALRRRRK